MMGYRRLDEKLAAKRHNPYNNIATDYLHLGITIKKLLKTNILDAHCLIIYVL